MKKIPWWQPQIGKHEYTFIHTVLKNNFPNEGELTRAFENEIKKLLGVKHALAVTSATAGMYLSLKALGVGFGDEVIVPDVTFIATANAVEMTGAKAILADIDPKTLTLDTQSFERAITSKTKAVIPVHVSGRAADLTKIQSVARKKGLFIVEDAAEAFMSKHSGKYLGTFGETGCFSFSPAKIITTGQGGAIVTNNDTLFHALRELKDQGRPKRGTGGDDLHYSVGFNFKFTDLQAAVGLGQLKYLKTRMRRSRNTNTLYRKYLDKIPEIQVLPFNTAGGELPQWTDALVENRDGLDAYLKSKGIDCRRFWFPIHQQKPYKLPDKQFPNTTKLSKKALWLPSAFTLTDQDIKTVCTHIKSFFQAHSQT